MKQSYKKDKVKKKNTSHIIISQEDLNKRIVEDKSQY